MSLLICEWASPTFLDSVVEGAHFNEGVERRDRIIETWVITGGNSGVPGLFSDYLLNRPSDPP